MIRDIVVVNGSLGGAAGNTEAVLAPLLRRLREHARVTEIVLAGGAPDPDTLAPLLAAAGGFVFATGTYWDSWGSPMQAFLEQATAFEASQLWLGKPAAVVVTMHSVGGKEVLSRLQGVLSTLGMQIPPMTGFAYSLATHLALRAPGADHLADFWQLDDLDTVAGNLLEAMRGGRNFGAWSVDRGDPRRVWMHAAAGPEPAPDAEALGSQILADIYDCDAAALDDADRIREAMLEAARRAGAEIVSHSVHHFSPHGVSGVVVIAESHLAIHTWPEHRYAALDLFTCGETIRPAACFDFLRQALGGGHYVTSRVRRGLRPIRAARAR